MDTRDTQLDSGTMPTWVYSFGDGSADGGIVALSLVKSPQLINSVKYAEIPESWHTPQRQRMVLLKNAGGNAQAFYDFLQQPAARQVFRRYGFALPGE